MGVKMIVKNYNKLLTNAKGNNKLARKLALNIIDAGINSILPANVIHQYIKLKGSILTIQDKSFNLSKFKRIFVIGGGKASGLMAKEIERLLGFKITGGLIIDHLGTAKLKRIKMRKGGHPVPDADGTKAANEMLSLVSNLNKDDLVLALISGGGSALMSAPADGISLKDLQKANDCLLKSGADIIHMNCVRKHISSLKGGQLTKTAYPATVISIMFSDVIGDDLQVIASGPTVPDDTTFKDALNVVKRYKQPWPKSVVKYLELGANGKVPDTPNSNSKIFKNTHNFILINAYTALQIMQEKARSLKLNSMIMSSTMEGEAREVGKMFGSIAQELLTHNIPLKRPAAILIGGETTVTIHGKGMGGRNQELVLGALKKLKGLDGVCLISAGSDGRDGPTDADGAVGDGKSYDLAHSLGLNIANYLENNDAYHFFKKTGDLLMTGPTGSNVADIMVIVVV